MLLCPSKSPNSTTSVCVCFLHVLYHTVSILQHNLARNPAWRSRASRMISPVQTWARNFTDFLSSSYLLLTFSASFWTLRNIMSVFWTLSESLSLMFQHSLAQFPVSAVSSPDRSGRLIQQPDKERPWRTFSASPNHRQRERVRQRGKEAQQT